jgi:alpha-methylacyl-CoA racemase
MMLADMGAEVIRVDRPGAQSSRPIHTQVLNRGRPSIALDLKSHEGRQALMRLLREADVLIEGYRPGVMERLGLGPDECLTQNPRLVYGRMTGWGQTGPLANAAGHDLNYLALTGALHALGPAGQPPITPLNVVGDLGGGGMYLAYGIVCALLETRSSGRGQVVDAAIVDGTASLMNYVMAVRAAGEFSDERGQNKLDGGCPWNRCYETADGKYVSVASVEPQFYAALLKQLGIAHEPLPDQHDVGGWPQLHKRFAEVIRQRTRDEWCSRMDGIDVCFAPVLTLSEAAAHDHNRERGTFLEVEGVLQAAPAPRFSRTTPVTPRAARPVGWDAEPLLAAWGLSRPELDALHAMGAFGDASR